MAGPHVTLGRKRTGTSGPDFAAAGADEQIVSLTHPQSDSRHLILTGMGTWAGRTSGTPVGRLGFWYVVGGEGHPGGVRPSALGASTGEISPSAGYTGSDGGQYYDNINFPSPVLLAPDTAIAVGAASRNGTLGVSMIAAADIDQPNESVYRKSISGTVMQSADGSAFTNEGQLLIWVNAEENVAPNQPGDVVRSGSSNTRRPTFAASFSDDNETLRNGWAWDRLEQYSYEVWWGGQRRDFGTRTAESWERTGRKSEHQIGVDVPFDTWCTYFIRHIDRGGKVSAARSHDFIVRSGASVDTPSSPPAFVNIPTAPGNIVATYRSSGGLNADRMVARLVNANGAKIADSAQKSVSVAPNSDLTMTWAESGFSLSAGNLYGMQVSARDTAGNWSGFGETRWFRANSGPTIPWTNEPTVGYVGSVLPDLVVTVTHPDGLPIHSVEVQLQQFGGGSWQNLGTRFATWIPGTDQFRVPVSSYSSLIPGHGVFRIRSLASDYHLYSGGTATWANGSWSNWRQFEYAAVPDVAITGPTSPIATMRPTINWTAPIQAAWRVTLWSSPEQAFVYDTGEQVGTVRSHTIAGAGQYWINNYQWSNGDGLYAKVWVRNAAGIWGSATDRYLVLEYPPIAELAISGSAQSLSGVDGTQYVSLSTSASTYAQDQFLAYVWDRQEITGFQGSLVPGTWTRIKREQNSGDLSLMDFNLKSHQWYRYYLSQEVRVGNDVIMSPPVSIDLMVSWSGTILHMPFDPLNHFVWLKYGEAGGRYEPQRRRTALLSPVQTVNRRAPHDYSGRNRVVDPSGTYTFINHDGQTALQHLDTLNRLYNAQFADASPDGRPHIMCWREGRGGPDSVLYVRLVDFIDRHGMGRTQVVDLQFEERHFALGASA